MKRTVEVVFLRDNDDLVSGKYISCPEYVEKPA